MSSYFLLFYYSNHSQTKHDKHPSTLDHFEFMMTILFRFFLSFFLIQCCSKSNEDNGKMCVLNSMQTQQQMRTFNNKKKWHKLKLTQTHTQTQTQEILLFFSYCSRAQNKNNKIIYSHIILVYVLCWYFNVSVVFYSLRSSAFCMLFCCLYLSLWSGLCVCSSIVA